MSTPMAAASQPQDDVFDMSSCVLPDLQDTLLDELDLLVQAAAELGDRLLAFQARLIVIKYDVILGGATTE